jgi:hypothetical protein
MKKYLWEIGIILLSIIIAAAIFGVGSGLVWLAEKHTDLAFGIFCGLLFIWVAYGVYILLDDFFDEFK